MNARFCRALKGSEVDWWDEEDGGGTNGWESRRNLVCVPVRKAEIEEGGWASIVFKYL